MKLFRHLFHRNIVEGELNEELQYHVEREAQLNVAKGMSPDAARRKAVLEFGGVEQIKEECRDQRPTRWIESIVQDVRYGLRTLRKNPSFTAVAVITLALGIGANTAIFSLVYATLVKPLPYSKPDRLITLRGNQSVPDTLDIGRDSRTLEQMGVFADWPLDMLDNSKPEQVISAIVAGDVFPALGISPQLGRYFTQEDSDGRRPVAVISDAFWHRYLGADPNVLGHKLTLSGSIYTVIGVMPKRFAFPRGESELWLPFTVGYPEGVNARGAHFTFAVGRLRSGFTLAQAQSDLDAVGAELGRRYPEEARTFTVMPLRDRLVAGVRTPLLVLFGAVSLVLLIACVNFSGLLISRTAARHREFQVRMSLGASRWRVLRQIVTESVVIACVGAIAGILLAAVGTQALMQLKPKDVTGLDTSVFSLTTLLFTSLIAVISGAAFGLAPAIQLFSASASFRSSGQTATSRTRLRSFMVVAECAMALVLLTGAGLLIRSFWKLLNVDPGFNPQQVLTARLTLPAKKYKEISSQLDFLTKLDRELHSVPGIVSAGIVSELPMSGSHMEHNLLIKGRPEPPKEREPEISAHETSPDYFGTMQIPLLSGRTFTEQDTATSEAVAVISQQMAHQYWPNESPIGAQVRWARSDEIKWLTIVGVVGDVRHDGLDDEAYPAVYVPLTQKQMAWKRFNSIVIRTRAADPMSSANVVQQAVWKTDPQLPITFLEPMETVMSESVAERRFNMVLLSLFAALALVLAVVGIYGITSYLVTQRTQEIGIRMALGAQPHTVLRMFVSEGLALSTVGAFIGAAGAFWTLRLAQGMLFQVGSSDPVAFTAAAAMLIMVAGLACYIPARRAAKIDPMRALRLD
jgi:putative ABC transport system permease protein